MRTRATSKSAPPVPEDTRVLASYSRLVRYSRPYLRRLILGIFFGIVCGGGTGSLLFAFQNNIAKVYNPENAIEGSFWLVAALLPLSALVLGVGMFLSKYLVSWVGHRVVRDLRNEVFDKLQELPLSYYTQSRTGELISRTTNDTTRIEGAVSRVLSDLVREPFVLLAAVVYLVYLNPLLAGLSLLLFPVCVIPVALFGKRVRRFSREGQEKIADMVSTLQEAIVGVRVVKAFGMEHYEAGKFAEQTKQVFSRAMRVMRARAANEPIITVISTIGLCLVLFYAKIVGMGEDELITFAAALVMMYRPVKQISRVHLTLQQSAAAADRIFEVLDTENTVTDRPGAKTFEGPVESIRFENVSFGYEESPILDGINLETRAGDVIAIVGSSGSGKTTLVSLLPRFFDVTAGAIRLNGEDIRDLTLRSLRSRIGLVTQDTILFNDTVANNIAYSRPEATREEIVDAAQRAHAHAFIRQMPAGYDTVVGERGIRLSGGQAQRISIARATLRNPPIMILDEATSALDTESERQVQAALNELMTDRTVFAIAHRLSTISHASKILVLDRGRIAEEGTHEELLSAGGLYKHLYDLQFKV